MKKIESLEEYQGLALRTMADLGDINDNLLHMNVGHVTELGEMLDPFKKLLAYKKPLDMVNVGEEVADMAWYMVNTATLLEAKLEINPEVEAELVAHMDNYLKGIREEEGEITVDSPAVIIRIAYAGLALPVDDFLSVPDLNGVVTRLIFLREFCTKVLKLDFYQLLTNNIAKLKVRYPEKFTEEGAISRDLETERATLEVVK